MNQASALVTNFCLIVSLFAARHSIEQLQWDPPEGFGDEGLGAQQADGTWVFAPGDEDGWVPGRLLDGDGSFQRLDGSVIRLGRKARERCLPLEFSCKLYCGGTIIS